MYLKNAYSRRLAAIIIGGGTLLCAQGVQTADLFGELRDGKGEAVAGAQVTLASPALQGTRTFLSDGKGRFAARLLPPGNYSITVVKANLQTLKVQQTLALGQSYSPRFTMQPMGTATVEVVATLAQMDKTNVTSSSNFSLDQVGNLPTDRNPEAMMVLTPGVADLGSQSVNGYAQVRGSLSSNNKFMVDGQDVADSVYGNRGVSVIDDAVDQVQIITGAISAEFGDVDGGVVNSVTKSGGNDFSGVVRSSLTNDNWNAVQPKEKRSTIVNKLNHSDSVSVGGPIIQDKLWFFVSGFQENLSESRHITGLSVYPGLGYAYTNNDKRLQTKLTYLVNQNHTLSFSFLTHRQEIGNNNYSAGDLATLEPQLSQDSIWSLNWAANWTPNLAMEARIGQKKEALTGGGTHPGVTPIYDLDIGYIYGNGLFNNNDGGDHRDNKSADIKFTLAFDAAGSHNLAFGMNYVNGIHQAQNQQSPTNMLVNITSYSLDPANTVDPNSCYLQTWQSSSLKAFDNSLGLYVNDRWSVDQHWSFNLGLRWDKYTANSQDSSASAGASGFSPRLGLKWDVLGDSTWQFAASFSRYNAKPLSNIVNSVSNAGNPTEIDYGYTGPVNPDGSANQSDAINPNNYKQAFNYSSPASTRLASGLRAPHTNEYQVSLSHSFKVMGNEGYVKGTLVRRDYKDLFDYSQGDNGHFTPPAPFDAAVPFSYIKVWENSDLTKRVYKDAELEAGLNTHAFNLAANITWASLQGNYQGEGVNSGPGGQGLKYFTTQDGVKNMYDVNQFNPYGPLTGHVPLRIRATADYHFDWSWGRTTVGALYRFDSGSHDNITRAISWGSVNSNFAPQIANSSTTQYKDGQRGQVIYPAQAYTDLAITQDFKLVKVGEKAVSFFVKVTAKNVFNHQQKISWVNLWNQGGDAAQSVNDPWIPDPSNGSTPSRGNFGEARSLALQAGFKF